VIVNRQATIDGARKSPSPVRLASDEKELAMTRLVGKARVRGGVSLRASRPLGGTVLAAL
jgi:hypothetical protein